MKEIEKIEIEPNTTTKKIVDFIEESEISLLNKDRIFEQEDLIKLKIELGKAQSDALILKDYFIPTQGAYKYSNIAKHLIELIDVEIRQEVGIALKVRKYFLSKYTKEQWIEIMKDVKQFNN